MSEEEVVEVGLKGAASALAHETAFIGPVLKARELRGASHLRGSIQAALTALPSNRSSLEQIAARNAAWVRRSYDVVLFETEGVLKDIGSVLNDNSFAAECRDFFHHLTMDGSATRLPKIMVVSKAGNRVTEGRTCTP